MKVLNDFKCPQGHISEQLVENTSSVTTCTQCDQDAYKIVATPRISLEGISGTFPGAADSWVKRRESHMKWEKKMAAANGPD